MPRRHDYVYPGVELNLRCPRCRSRRLAHDGFGVVGRKKVQRWLCHNPSCRARTLYPRGLKV